MLVVVEPARWFYICCLVTIEINYLAPGEVDLSDILPSYRNSRDLEINKKFLIGADKEKILYNLRYGFRADWAPSMPSTFPTPPNFFNSPVAIQKCRARFDAEIRAGRMLGGVGWTSKHIENFFGRPFYTTPCGAVAKNNDPAGRIIHNYSYPSPRAGSVNSALINTSVEYISFKERVLLLDKVDWFIKADLKNGYRQLPLHPSDWHTQVYSLGPEEFFIDINMPFGKANSSKIFCEWTSTWRRSFQHHFQKHYSLPIALASYVDDFFGGPVRTGCLKSDKKTANLLITNLISVGEVTNTRMNPLKCLPPSRSMNILGIVFDSKRRLCTLPIKKVVKYLRRIKLLHQNRSCTPKELEKIIGNLVFAAWVFPFGTSFISHISYFLYNSKHKLICLDKYGLLACEVWELLLKKNAGLPFDFVLGRLPKQKNEWFADASTAFGYGGICGNYCFKISHKTWFSLAGPADWGDHEKLFIAYRELLAVLFAFHGFARLAPRCFIRVNSDNTNTVNWINKGRCSKKIGFLLLSAIQFYKAKYMLRVKAYHIKSEHNVSADALSRGITPQWLKRRGSRIRIDIKAILKLIDNPVIFWKTI